MHHDQQEIDRSDERVAALPAGEESCQDEINEMHRNQVERETVAVQRSFSHTRLVREINAICRQTQVSQEDITRANRVLEMLRTQQRLRWTENPEEALGYQQEIDRLDKQVEALSAQSPIFTARDLTVLQGWFKPPAEGEYFQDEELGDRQFFVPHTNEIFTRIERNLLELEYIQFSPMRRTLVEDNAGTRFRADVFCLRKRRDQWNWECYCAGNTEFSLTLWYGFKKACLNDTARQEDRKRRQKEFGTLLMQELEQYRTEWRYERALLCPGGNTSPYKLVEFHRDFQFDDTDILICFYEERRIVP